MSRRAFQAHVLQRLVAAWFFFFVCRMVALHVLGRFIRHPFCPPRVFEKEARKVLKCQQITEALHWDFLKDLGRFSGVFRSLFWTCVLAGVRGFLTDLRTLSEWQIEDLALLWEWHEAQVKGVQGESLVSRR